MKVYVDTVIKHGVGQGHTSYGGQTYDTPEPYDQPAVPWTRANFYTWHAPDPATLPSIVTADDRSGNAAQPPSDREGMVTDSDRASGQGWACTDRVPGVLRDGGLAQLSARVRGTAGTTARTSSPSTGATGAGWGSTTTSTGPGPSR